MTRIPIGTLVQIHDYPQEFINGLTAEVIFSFYMVAKSIIFFIDRRSIERECEIDNEYLTIVDRS